MNKNVIILAGAALLLLAFKKKPRRRGSIELPPPETYIFFTMTAGSVLYSNLKLTQNTGHVFKGGEKVFLVKDYGKIKEINYHRPDQKVLTGYVKSIDIRK